MKPSILKVLAYFDLFAYPVSAEEIQFFLDRPVDKKLLSEDLQRLVQESYLFRQGDLFSLRNDPSLMLKRLEGNARAASLLKTARRISQFLYQFPFVRGISISGSLSKNYADENADIDFFIITKSGRLWLARTIMHMFKKLSFLTGHQHWFCMNYYVDEAALVIEEKNIFTAIELITLLPVCGGSVVETFFRSNDWASDYFPQYKLRTGGSIAKDGWLKKFAEFSLDNRLGDRIDDYLCKLTSRRWSQKEKRHKLNIKGNRMGLKTGKHFSKPNPVFFQEKILSLYKKNLEEWEKKWSSLRVQDSPHFFFREMIK